jgi:trehalose 6-phosphate synthase/phosphatase
MQRGSQEGVPTSPPAQDENADINPALHPERAAVPVTPGTCHADSSPRTDEIHSDQPGNTTESTNPPNKGPTWNTSRETEAPESPSEAAKGARTSEELLRCLSLGPEASQKSELADIGPRVAHPNLHLSGHIISVAFCMPYEVGFAPNVEWVSETQIVVWAALTSHRTSRRDAEPRRCLTRSHIWLHLRRRGPIRC